MAVSGFVFGTGPAAEVGAEAVKEAEDGLGVVVASREVFELEAEGEAEFDADVEPVSIAGIEAGDKAGAEIEVVPEPKSVAELVLVVSGHKLSSEAAVAWNSGVSLGVVLEPRVGLVSVAASEAADMMAPCENIQGALSEVLPGVQLGATEGESELLDKPETVQLDLFAEGMVGELDVSAGLGVVTLALVSTAGVETDPGGNLGGNTEVVL